MSSKWIPISSDLYAAIFMGLGNGTMDPATYWGYYGGYTCKNGDQQTTWYLVASGAPLLRNQTSGGAHSYFLSVPINQDQS